jgi:hypothetical protein
LGRPYSEDLASGRDHIHAVENSGADCWVVVDMAMSIESVHPEVFQAGVIPRRLSGCQFRYGYPPSFPR